MNIIPEINRIWQTGTVTIGIISAPGMTPLFTLELPWKNNQKNISCIPRGLYPLEIVNSTKNKDIGKAYEIIVPGREDIQIHIANYPRQIQGCVALGYEASIDEESIGKSEKAIRYFMDYMSTIECNRIYVR
jgi:hypothetical protein